jgi:hypothetical protein
LSFLSFFFSFFPSSATSLVYHTPWTLLKDSFSLNDSIRRLCQ